jgi:aminoglycoside 6'-N-acetyltransferase
VTGTEAPPSGLEFVAAGSELHPATISSVAARIALRTTLRRVRRPDWLHLGAASVRTPRLFRHEYSRTTRAAVRRSDHGPFGMFRITIWPGWAVRPSPRTIPSGIYAVTVERLSDGFLSWRPLIAGDLPMLAEWLREPQVARWWNLEATLAAVERDFGPSTRGEEPGEDLVVLLDGRPIGLLQRSAICDYPRDLTEFSAVIEVPVGAVELDYFIADPALRGRGLGSRMIAAAVEDTWNSNSDAPAVLVAVVAGNVASWRALEKAGLKRVAEGPMSSDNPIDDALHYIYRVDRPGAASSAYRP